MRAIIIFKLDLKTPHKEKFIPKLNIKMEELLLISFYIKLK